MSGRPPAGVVLTGGASTRMGTDKAAMAIDGQPMAARVADTLREAGCHPVWYQGGNAEVLSRSGPDVVSDIEPGAGPVVAILSALRHAAGADVIVAACDLVDLDAAAIRLVGAADVVGDFDVVVAYSGGRIHLLSRWSASALEPLAALVERGVRSYRQAVASLAHVEVEVPSGAVVNVNRPGDVDQRQT